jgi:predicted negative regulator of RcsB-dependent stress response
MTMTATPSDSQSAGENRDTTGAEQGVIILTFEDKLKLFWRRHSGLVIAFCVVVLLAIIGVGVWENLARKKDREIQNAYTAVTTPEGLKTFAESHGSHPLAGIAYLRLADDAFAAGKITDALATYEKAANTLTAEPFASRVKLGLAVSKVADGKTAEGTAGLKQLADDANQFKGIRAEAAYHLTSIAAEAGVAAEVQKYSELLMQIDPTSSWTQRAFALRASLPPDAAVTEPAKDGSVAVPSQIQFAPAAK